MQNIDPVYFLIPVIVIAFSVGLVLYWHRKKCFTRQVLLYSFVAYTAAIALKYVIQIPTIGPFENAFGAGNLVALGAYFGIQTMVLEVGGAYVVARYAAKRRKISRRDAGAYGLSLALWENAGYFGGLTLLNYISYYAVLSTGTNSVSELVYNALLKSSPGLFLPPSQALPDIGFAILERVSSLFAHLAWGALVVLAVVYRRKILLAIALPMGLIDFLVPFAGTLGTAAFELLIFVISVGFLLVTVAVARWARSKETQHEEAVGVQSNSTVDMDSRGVSSSLAYMNFRRAVSYGKIYLIIGIAMSVLIGSVLVEAIKSVSSAAPGGTPAISGTAGSILPLFALVGSLGALMVFVSDKDRGVYEYMIAYGVDVSSIFWSIVLATLGLASIILAFSVSSMTLVMIASGVRLSASFVELIVFYSIPVSFTTTMLGSMVGMIWSSLATRRVGVNSPVGVAPYVGLAPIIAILLLSSRIPSGEFIPLVGAVSFALFIIVVAMIGVSTKKLVRERFLSSA